ncbi:MAG: hypothetical protein ACHQ03_08255 [Candidatus Bathyarchaeia archaeon]
MLNQHPRWKEHSPEWAGINASIVSQKHHKGFRRDENNTRKIIVSELVNYVI